MSNEEFTKLYEESLKELKEGDLVQGKIVQIDDEYVMVDVGYKFEGRIKKEEFLKRDEEFGLKIGDIVDVYVEKVKDESGAVYLSKKRADIVKAWREIVRAYHNNGDIEGTVVERVKGGYRVDIGILAFLPNSHVDIKSSPTEDILGSKMRFKILKYSRKRDNVIVSRKLFIEEEMKRKREAILDSLKEGMVVTGKVKSITDYGAFVDLGGVDGLLHIGDISWKRVNHPSDFLQVGDEIKVKVLNYDRQKKRISLGLKQLLPDPWEDVEEKFKVGEVVKGKVVNIKNFGAFVDVGDGVEGLIHISEMSWVKKLKDPKSILNVGDIVEVRIVDIDKANRKMALSLRQVKENPWDIVDKRYPVGSIVEGTITSVTDFGIFVACDLGIEGLVHLSDISWSQKGKSHLELYKKGDKIKAVVLNIDKEKKRFSLGIKQLLPDPWESVDKKYKEGTTISGTITNITDFGIFVELEEGVEGLIHVSEVDLKKGEDLTKVGKVGEKVEARVLNVDPKKRRIALSLKRLGRLSSPFYSLDGEVKAVSTLGDFLKDKLSKEGLKIK